MKKLQVAVYNRINTVPNRTYSSLREESLWYKHYSVPSLRKMFPQAREWLSGSAQWRSQPNNLGGPKL